MLTIPNLLTFARALGVPLFIWVGLDGSHDWWALIILVVGGATDYLDGKVARALNQTSRFGELADPAIDRLYIAATLVVLLIRGAVPLWMVIAIFGRDLLLAVQLFFIKRAGYGPLKVTYIGKAATFNLLYAFPCLLLTLQEGAIGTLATVFGWAFAIWGLTLYLFTGVRYFIDGARTLRLGKA